MEKISKEEIDAILKRPLQDDINYRHIAGRNRRAFVKIFEDIVYELPNLSGIELKVYIWLSIHMDFNKASFVMDEDFWGELKQSLGVSREYARRVITSLKRKSFVYDDKFRLYISSKYASKKKA